MDRRNLFGGTAAMVAAQVLRSGPARAQTQTQSRPSWVVGSVLKQVGEFEASVKRHPLIRMGTTGPYSPPR